MAITENDLKLLKSITMSNEPNGGGVATNQVIADNLSNAIFDDVTSQDQIIGKVNERKVFLGVQSTNADKVLAAMAFLTKIPKNENTTMNLYRSDSFFDTRADRVIKKKGTTDINTHELRLDNNAFNDDYADSYGLSVGKYMSCFVTGTISAGATQIVVTGIDGILNTTVYADANLNTNVTAYGTSGLMKILQNNFVITNGTNSENIKVKSVKVDKYINSFSPDETYNAQNDTYTTNSPNIGSYSNNIETKKPYKKYVATLTLTTPLTYSYVAATENDSATWLSEETKLLTIGGTIEKFYTAKPLKNPIAAGNNSIDIFENINHVLPIEDGVTYDPDILGIDPTGFAADGNYTAFSNGDMVMILNEVETTGTYASGQTVNLSRPNLAKITLRDKNGVMILSSKYTPNLLAGNVKMLDLTGVQQPITIIDRIEDLCLIKSNTGSTITETVNEEVVTNLAASQTVTTTTKNALVTLTNAATMLETGFSASITVMSQDPVYIQANQDVTLTTDNPVVPTNFNENNIVDISTFTAKAIIDTSTTVQVDRRFLLLPPVYGGFVLATPYQIKVSNTFGALPPQNIVLDTVVVKVNLRYTNGLVLEPEWILSSNDYSISGTTIQFLNADLAGIDRSITITYKESVSIPSSNLTTLVEMEDYIVTETYGFNVLKPTLKNKVISIAYKYTPISLSATVTNLIAGTDYTIEPKKGIRFISDQCLNTNIDVDYTYTSTTTQSVTRTIKTNNITLNRKITRDYPVLNTVVANCMSFGTLQATTSTPFDVETWDNVWTDTASGAQATAQFNHSAFPITVTNYSAITERWAIVFVTENTVDIVGEHVGVIASNVSIDANIAPQNPATAQPYFTMNAAGFGANWQAGNAIRFNTKGATAPFWVMQSIKSGESTNNDFNFAIELRAEVDTVA